METSDRGGIGERVRRACIEAALAAYEDAGVQGLCAEGRWESAVGAMRRLELGTVIGDAGLAAAAPALMDNPDPQKR